jgi:hypothetical protein
MTLQQQQQQQQQHSNYHNATPSHSPTPFVGSIPASLTHLPAGMSVQKAPQPQMTPLLPKMMSSQMSIQKVPQQQHHHHPPQISTSLQKTSSHQQQPISRPPNVTVQRSSQIHQRAPSSQLPPNLPKGIQFERSSAPQIPANLSRSINIQRTPSSSGATNPMTNPPKLPSGISLSHSSSGGANLPKSITVTKGHSNSGSSSGSLSPITTGYDKLTRYVFDFVSLD